MGNCTSGASADFQQNNYGCPDNAVHISAAGSLVVGSVYSQQGAKGVNQDAALLYQGYGSEDGAFCGAFDGHGMNGQIVSRVVRNQLPSLLLNQRKIKEFEEACDSAFKALDKEIKLLENVDCCFSGTTAVVVIKQGEELVVANLGDSRAVLGTLTDSGIKATQLTVDLKPGVPAEAERIKKSNGRVFALEQEPHIQRVWLPDEDIPGLAMSRAFGDFDMKSYGITVTPEVTHHRLTSDDYFVVLATDGVWDVLSNEEVVSIVYAAKSKETAAKAVVDRALAAWKHKFPKAKVDDTTAVCLFLQEIKEDNLLPVTT